jgi:uncharacterized protein YpuA (DUF1002 family)
MKKLSVRLSLLCLLAILLIPFAGCKKEETEVEETPATTSDTTTSTSMSTETSTSMGTDMGTTSTDMGTMGTDMTTSSPMGSDTTQPPAGK